MDNLRRLRIEKGITQAELSSKLEVEQTTISKWENGEAFPRKPALDKLCAFFNCKVDDLL